MLLSEAIEALAVATLADGRSERTAGDCRQKLHALLVFLGDRDAANVTADDLRRFLVDLRTRPTRYTGHPARAVLCARSWRLATVGQSRCTGSARWGLLASLPVPVASTLLQAGQC